jgi:hypothetical protein
VTAVYVGWRGARVDETWLRRKLGSPPESFIGKLAAIPETVAAALTLFDRKPVSEQIAPGVISLLDLVSNTIMLNDGPKENDSRLIIFGHSLGGNTLAVGIKERLIKSIRELTPQTKLKSPIGDLTILLNPASEAENWTTLQRTVQERVSALNAFGISSFREQPVTDKLFPCAFSLHTSLPRASALALVAPRDFGSPSREPDPRWPPGVGLINLNLHHLRFPQPTGGRGRGARN